MHKKHFPLTPIISPWIPKFLTQKSLVKEAIEAYGSPINIHNLQPFQQNMDAYQALFKEHGLAAKIFFARKANKSKMFLKKAKELGHGIDTASYRELKQAIDAGLTSADIVCTAAVKNRQLIQLAIQHHIPLVIDNEDECDLIFKIAEELNMQVSVQVRISGFKHNNQILPSRFGFDLKKAFVLITEFLGAHNTYNRLHYTGLHFHLNGYSIPERATALHQAFELIEQLQEQGISSQSLDFGGGILMNYLSDKNEWEEFQAQLKQAVLGQVPEITYQNDGLGWLKIQNQLEGNLQVYPYYNELNKTDFLDAILQTKNNKGQRIIDLAKLYNIQLRIEPGRSALDQVGISVAQVAFRRHNTAGDLLIGLEMNRTQLRSSSADFLLDPIHIINSPVEPDEIQGYLVGAYCLEQELILKRKLNFTQLPQVGDYFVFINTAGYMMHFYESEAHLFELAQNLEYNAETETLKADA